MTASPVSTAPDGTAASERLDVLDVLRGIALALAVFGAFSHLVFGYHVLLEYAVWGLPLLLVRTWPVKRLSRS